MALLLLVGGAIVNVAVAWGGLRFGGRITSEFVVNDEDDSLPLPFDVPLPAMINYTPSCLVDEVFVGWSPPYPSFSAQYVIAGFPIRSIHGGLGFDQWPDSAAQVRPNSVLWELTGSDILPLRPILTGSIINILFYTMLLWLLFFAPFTARRMLRRRRGVCEKCAYPVGVNSNCTECGAAVARKAEA